MYFTPINLPAKPGWYSKTHAKKTTENDAAMLVPDARGIGPQWGMATRHLLREIYFDSLTEVQLFKVSY